MKVSNRLKRYLINWFLVFLDGLVSVTVVVSLFKIENIKLGDPLINNLPELGIAIFIVGIFNYITHVKE